MWTKKGFGHRVPPVGQFMHENKLFFLHPTAPPYVTSILVDFNYMGYCAKISFEHLRAYLVQKGELKKEDIDASFVSVIFLKVSI